MLAADDKVLLFSVIEAMPSIQHKRRTNAYPVNPFPLSHRRTYDILIGIALIRGLFLITS